MTQAAAATCHSFHGPRRATVDHRRHNAGQNSKANRKTSSERGFNPATASVSLARALSVRAGATPQSTSPPNKKYTTAAASAVKTMSSLTSSTRQPNLPNLLSESALMDKETNAIYWQGGADIFSTSLTRPYLTQRGVLHVKATILTVALWLWVWGRVSRHLASRFFGSNGGKAQQGHKLLFALPIISLDENSHPILRRIASLVSPIIQFLLLLIHSVLYLRLPRYSPKVLAATILLYLLEAYSCSTRRYLSHAMDAPAEVESYLERIRGVEPVVTWKVRCFHYEEREFWNSCKGMGRFLESWTRKSDGGGDDNAGDVGKIGGKRRGKQSAGIESSGASPSASETFAESPPSWMARKVITHQAKATYKFSRWEDHTVASLWKRSQSFSSTSQEAPFSKLTLSKLLVLKDKNTREDYFAQQAAFVMLEGRKDVHAEFATSIEVEGFRPKLLAVRPVRRASNISAALFRQHVYVLFTLLGLSLPYRIWFAKHCDEIRVTVVKETSSAERSEGETTEGKSSWFRKWGRGASSPAVDISRERAQALFRSRMHSLSLYEEEHTPLDENATVKDASLEIKNDVPRSELDAEPREGASDENMRDESAAGEATTHGSQTSTSVVDNIVADSPTTENIDPLSALDAVTPDSPSDLSSPIQPAPESPTLLNKDADEAR
eukprot:CAMPEP_0172557394 /NCGR_PEP_ID=MMETSP1067-20121228/72984_1 /TAXON_ID=265564 ORGANISM="Thalassiosira punctigera, Strain Tpunct2005C2" /NCGR_SAMPLE_ID=MMETSP1067 /ASSEMBLY_ACC=CAM_ASM_000444 /LENGTH=667 /DNA_ID=CAMNT_0013346467 /DNA_START=87 /DNA_END=2090 /DNA_ORIENTATION=-